MAIEDGVVLSELLSFLPSSSPDLLDQALSKFCELRHPRIKFLQEKAATLYGAFAYPDGPLQQERDQRLKSEMSKMEEQENGALEEELGSNYAENSPNFLSDVAFRNFIFDYDAANIGQQARVTLGLEH